MGESVAASPSGLVPKEGEPAVDLDPRELPDTRPPAKSLYLGVDWGVPGNRAETRKWTVITSILGFHLRFDREL
jgi:hypothetical protein